MNCKFCGKECKNDNSLRNHQRLCKLNPNRQAPPPKTEKWKEAMRKKTKKNQWSDPNYKMKDYTREKQSLANTGKTWSDERKNRHSEIMKEAVKKHPDSYTKNNVCGRVKIINYNGVNLKGSWELKVAEWLDKNKVKWENEANPQPYYWNDGWHLYFPDFYIRELDTYIEVKGYKTKRDEAKWSQFKGTLLIIDKTNIFELEHASLDYILNNYEYK